MPTLFTLGCQGLTPNALEPLLIEAGVSTLADVRADPTTPEPEFSTDRLAERLEGAGVGYVRLDGLADPTGRAGSPAEDYAVLRGLALDEDVCLLGDGGEQRLSQRLASETGLPLVRLSAKK